MAFELLQGTGLERGLIGRHFRIGRDDITALLQLQGALEGIHLDFAPDALGPLAPFELDGFDTELVQDIFGHAVAGVFHIHLHQDIPIAVMVAAVGLDTALHLRGALDQTVSVKLQFRIDAADVFPADQGDAADGGPHGEMLPVLAGNIGTAQGTGKNRHLHFNFVVGTEFGLRVHGREGGLVGIGLDPFGAERIPHDVEMGIIHRIVFVRPGRYPSEGLRIEQFPAAEGGPEGVAVAFTPVNTAAAQAGLRRHIAGSILGLEDVVGVRSLQIHTVCSFVFGLTCYSGRGATYVSVNDCLF